MSMSVEPDAPDRPPAEERQQESQAVTSAPVPTPQPSARQIVVSIDSSFNIDEDFFWESTPVGSEAATTPNAPPSPEAVVPEPDRHVSLVRARFADHASSTDLAEVITATPGSALSVADLLEYGAVVDWKEAVVIARHICEAILRHPAAGAHEYRLDARHIQITEGGEVRVLLETPGSDPFVKQVGNVLRALLENTAAPASLRLFVSQTAVGVPDVGTVQELAAVLRSFEVAADSDPIRAAFLRGREGKYSISVENESPKPPRPTVPVVKRQRSFQNERTATDEPHYGRHRMLAGVCVLVLIAVAVVAFSRRSVGPEVTAPVAQSGAGAQPVQVHPPSTDVAATVPVARPPIAPVSRGARSTQTDVRSSARVLSPEQSTSARRAAAMPLPRTAVSTEEAGVSETTRPAGEQVDALEREFDRLLLQNPLYQLDREQATPESIAALQRSKRVLLPALARRDLERGRQALDMADFDTAIDAATRVSHILDDADFGPVPPDLRGGVQQLLSEARSKRDVENLRVYTIEDRGVIPPSPIGRQLPAFPPAGLSSSILGELELLIGLDGRVEEVRLHTKVNRYHERMIVSAAKAWRYQPAARDGKSVRFRLFMSVNLPED
jgi:hypothetical protein